MSQRRPHQSARSTRALILGLAALRAVIIALVIATLGGSAKEPKNVHPQRYRAVLLPTLPDEPSAQDIMGPSAMVESESEGTAHQPDRGAAHAEALWYGLCPAKSVVSLDDFRRMVRSDQRLAAYYGGFNWAKARLVTTAAPQLVYVSYQKAGALARTQHPMLLPKGDTLLTDGVLQARTYCCNEVFEIVDAPPPAALRRRPACIAHCRPPHRRSGLPKPRHRLPHQKAGHRHCHSWPRLRLPLLAAFYTGRCTTA